MNSTTVCDTSKIRRSRRACPLRRHAQSDWVRVFKTETEIGTPARVEAETWKFARQRGSSPALGTRGLYVLWNCYAANSHAATPEALLLEKRASFIEDQSKQHLWAYLPQPFCRVWHFLQLQVQWSHDNTTFFVKEIRKGSVSPTRPSASPTSCTWIGHAYVDRARFFQVHALVERISSRSVTCLYKTELERKRTRFILSKLFLFWEKEWEREREKDSERERTLQ